MSEGRSRRVVIFITTSTIALSAYASPASSAVFPAYESCRKYPDTRNAEGTLAIIAAVLRLLLCPHQGTPKRNPQPRNTAQPLVSPDSLAPPPFRPMARPRPHDPFKPTRSLLQPPTSVLTDQTARNFQEEMSDGLS